MVEQLGEGGMAAVYRAFDQRLQVWRAIKILLPQFAGKPKIFRRFEAEAQTMALLEHRHIVRVYDVGTDGTNIAYIVMELVEGGCLVDWLEHHGPMPARMAVRACQEVCRGLAAAHDKGIVHRDVKPHNVMVTRDGICRVTDFGIARVSDPENSQTKTGSVMGTWGYMAPEQRTNAKGVDERGDVYAVGATLYTLLTDRMPMDLFAAERNAEILDGIDEILIPILIKSTEYDREDRYSSVIEMDAALEEIYEQLPHIAEGTPALALDAPPAPARPDPSVYVPATEIGEGGVPVANPTLLPQHDKGTAPPANQVTLMLEDLPDHDPAKGPDTSRVSSASTVVRPSDGPSMPADIRLTPVPAPKAGTSTGMVAGAAMAVWGIVGLVLLLALLLAGAWFLIPGPPPPPVEPTAAPEPKPVIDPTPVGPKPVTPEPPTPVGPKPVGPKPVGPKPVGPKPVGPKPPTPVPQPVEPVAPVVPVPPPEPKVVKCLKLASPVGWNSAKSGVLFKFKPCEGDFPDGKRVVLHYRSDKGPYRAQPLGVSSQRWAWRMPASKATGKIDWYVDGDMGGYGSASSPKVFKP